MSNLVEARRNFQNGLGVDIPWTNIVERNGAFTFDEVLLVPQAPTHIESRSHVNTSVQFGPYTLQVPIISAPMDTVTGEEMVRAMHACGGIGALPRPNESNLSNILDICYRLSTERIPCLYSVGLKNGVQHAEQLKDRGAQFVLLDTAHGGMQSVVNLAHELLHLDLMVVVGNIATYQQAEFYRQEGINIARVGIGPGSACETREVAGVGFPQLTAVLATTETGIYVIADGGIKKPADAAKAIGAGAEVIMLGGVLAGTNETPGKVVNGKKEYRGQASTEYMNDNGIDSSNRVAEGVSTQVAAKGPVADIIKQIEGGIRSAMSYSDAITIAEFHKKARFVYAPHAHEENRAHILK